MKYNPSLRPKIAQEFYGRGEVAFKLRDMNAAEGLFGQAVQFDPALNAKIAVELSDAAMSDLDFKDFDTAERFARQAVSYDPDAARKQAQALFAKLSSSLCYPHTLGKPRFMGMMKLCDELGLPDATRETVPYRFAYAMELYENGPRPQAIDILRDVVRASPPSPARASRPITCFRRLPRGASW